MATFTMQNGRAKRKQLSDELDRLERVIDCLAENLNAAVADAVKDGARTAVREALTEIINHPAAATLLRPAPPEPPATPAARPSMWSRVRVAAFAVIAISRRKVVAAIGKVKAVAVTAIAAVRARVVAARAKAWAVRQVLGASRQLKRALIIGLGVGVVVTGVSLLDHTVASVLSGAGAAVTAVAVQVAVWWRKVVQDWAAA